MTVLVTTLALCVVALALHVLLWRIRVPKRQTRALAALFALVACAWALLPHPVVWPEVVHILFFYGALAVCYVLTYSAIENDSPTLSLIRRLEQAGANGLSFAEVDRFVEAHPFVGARLGSLMDGGLVREERGSFQLTGKRPLFFQAILAFRRLYGPIEQGG